MVLLHEVEIYFDTASEKGNKKMIIELNGFQQDHAL